MIRVNRGLEPQILLDVRNYELPRLRALNREPVADDILGYRVVADHLCKIQHYKCCYCEQRIKSKFNDVEHYRPKGRANRTPGCNRTHGYWWLAYTWENLLFACPSCNRSGKNDLFPLRKGSISLDAEQNPPGMERPLLIDPGAANPAEHIEFFCAAISSQENSPAYWWARGRNSSVLGETTVSLLGLNKQDYLEIRGYHYMCVVRPRIEDLAEALANGTIEDCHRRFQAAKELLRPTHEHRLLSFDALHASGLSNALANRIGEHWPNLDQLDG